MIKLSIVATLLITLLVTLGADGHAAYIQLRIDLANEALCIKDYITSGYHRKDIHTTLGTCYVEMK